jgi:hypothetical protein
MDTSKVNDWLQIIASLGVLAGLILVAFELKQNTAVAEAEHSRVTYLTWLDIAAIEMEGDLGRVVIKSYEEPDELTGEDLYSLNAWLISIMSLYAYGSDAMELDISIQFSVIDEDYARYLFGTRYARHWFERNRSWLGAANVEVIERVIQESPIMTEWPRLDEYYSPPK